MKTVVNYFRLALYVYVISSTFISCSNDEFFGFDDDYYNELYNKCKSSDFLDLTSIDLNNLSNSDLSVITQAINRMGIITPEGTIGSLPSHNNFNLSDNLFNIIVGLFNKTNTLVSNRNDHKRKKNTNRETDVILDCFVISLSNYGHGAPSYDEIASICSKKDPNWRRHGVLEGLKESIFIACGVPYLISEYGFSNNRDLDNAVVVIKGQPVVIDGITYIVNHDVNGTYYVNNPSSFDYIFYCDYQNFSFGIVPIGMVNRIFYYDY